MKRVSNWHLQRLRAMSSAEIAWRLRTEVQGVVDRYASPLVWGPTQSFATAPGVPLGFLTPERASEVARCLPSAAADTIAQADRLREGRFSFFGYPEFSIAGVDDYSRDPVTGNSWPRSYGPSIDFRTGAYGDPKWIWELNRLQHLPTLVAAWLLTGEESYAVTAADVLDAWIVSNRVTRGIAWANGFEAGLRGISIALCYDALRDSDAQSTEARGRTLGSLGQHAKWVRRRQSRFSSANNHLIGELAGLTIIALLAPELTLSREWAAEGLAGLSREATLQVLPDGAGAEQAFAYSVFVLDLLLLVTGVLDARDLPTPEPILAALTRGGHALDDLVAPHEPEPTYGDADEGRAVVLDATGRRDARDLITAIAARTKTAGLSEPDRPLDATARWLFGEIDVPGNRTHGTRSAYLADAGIVVLRDSTRRVSMDVGPLGYLSLAAHGHADALQVTVVDDGVDLVIDPGTGSYYGDAGARRFFRGTSAHATVCVDGRDQAEQRGPFLWSDHYSASATLVDLNDNVVVAQHEAYARLDEPVLHRRFVTLDEGLPLLVYDHLETSGSHDYVQTWPLGPELDVEDSDSTFVRLVHPSGRRFVLAVAASTPGTLEIVRGESEPSGGWWSPRLEAIEPAWVCRWRFNATGPVHSVAALASDTGSVALGVEDGSGSPRVLLNLDGVRVEYLLSMDQGLRQNATAGSAPLGGLKKGSS
jgi:hypothetical protein